MNLRPYQIRAIDKVNNAFADNKQAALIVLPTGLGKTCCMASIAEKEVNEGGRVLFLAHRKNLLKQAAEEIENMTGVKTGYISGNTVPDTDIVLSSIQAMSKDKRLNSFKKDAFSMIMIDEAHHILAKSYDKIIEYFEKAKVLGVTATPRRGDDKDISEKFNEVASEYTLCEAINEEWLSPIVLQNCPVRIDVSKTHLQAGDYSLNDIDDALKPYMEAIADQVMNKAAGRKTLIFVPLVATAKSFAEIFRGRGARADYVSGDRKDTPDIMDKFKRGELDILINSMLLTEGYNEPYVDCIVNLRITRSEALLRQIIGRGTRKAEGKENLLILDFFWKDRKGRQSLSVSDIIAFEMGVDTRDLPEVMKRCKSYKGEPKDTMELVRQIGTDVRKEREAALLRALKKAEIEERRRKRLEEARAKYLKEHPDRMALVSENPKEMLPKLIAQNEARQISKHVYLIKDNFGLTFFYTDIPAFKALGIDCYKVKGLDELNPPTEKQQEYLKKTGIDEEERFLTGEKYCFVNKGYSGFIIGTLIGRSKRGLCSYKQAKLLCKKGVKDCRNIRFYAASKAIDLLSRNNWVAGKAFWSLIEDEINHVSITAC